MNAADWSMCSCPDTGLYLFMYICINVSFINLLQVNKFNCMLHFKYQKKTCSFWSAVRTPWFSSWGSLFWWYSQSRAKIRLRSSDLQLTKSRRWRDSLNGNLSTLESWLTLSHYDPFQDHIGVHRVEQSLGAAGDGSQGPEPFPVPSGSSLVFTAEWMNWGLSLLTCPDVNQLSSACVYLMYWKTKCCLLLICSHFPSTVVS